MKNFIVSNRAVIKDCLSTMNKNRNNFLIVLDKNKKVLGTFSMGDLRIALYNGAKLNSNIKKHYNKKPKVLVKGKNFINQARSFFIKSDV